MANPADKANADKAKQIFLSALDQDGDPVAFINNACGDDHELLERVRALLSAHQDADGFLAASNLDATVDSAGAEQGEATRSATAENASQSGEQIGPYKLIEAIGEGGMGTVWVASQSEPIKRRVAIKLIKAGMDSHQVLARFEAERQALAMMDHPNIARVLDGGVTSQGRPYFAMDYVKGVPLTEYCDHAMLSVKERLELFLPICSAVQHAHQKGIVHRDLKPSNILVCLYDGVPVPKVIDFGLAKAMHHSLTDQSLYTAHGMMVGTPLYMSPEQAEHNNLDIDTRTDVYALGVVLYELLTGTTPLEKSQLKDAAYNEVLRLIKEVEPPKPSTRLSGNDSLPSVAAQRNIDPAHLTRRISGDLDWVVMKALAKERSRRYETANGLAADIRRHLCDEPVNASPPSTRYRMTKFVKRNKGPVFAVSLLLLSLIAGIAGTAWQAREAEKARAEQAQRAEGERLAKLAAQKAQAEAEEAAIKERMANQQAQKRLVQIKKSNEILGSIFEDLDPSEIARKRRPLQAVLVERLDKAVELLEGEAIGDDRVVASMQKRFAGSLLGLGALAKAKTLVTRALDAQTTLLGADDPETLDTMALLALVHLRSYDYQKAIPLLEKTLKATKSQPDVIRTANIMHNLANAYRGVRQYDKAVSLGEQALEINKKAIGIDHANTLAVMYQLAHAYSQNGQMEKGVALGEESVERTKRVMGAEHPWTFSAMEHLAVAYKEAGQIQRALALFEQALRGQTRTLGQTHLDTMNTVNHLQIIYRKLGQHKKEVLMLEQLVPFQSKTDGPTNVKTLASMYNLAVAYRKVGRVNEAVPLLKKVLKLRTQASGQRDLSALQTMNELAVAQREQGNLTEALTLQRKNYALMKEHLGPEHSSTLTSMGNLAQALHAVGQYQESVQLKEQLIKLNKKKRGSTHPGTLVAMNDLASTYQMIGRLNDAISLYEKCLGGTVKVLGNDHPNTLTIKANLGQAYLMSGQFDKAIQILKESVQQRTARLGPEHPSTFVSINNLGSAYNAAKRIPEAIALMEKALKSQTSKLGRSHPITLHGASVLAGAYKENKQLANAIELFEQNFEFDKATLGLLHPHTFSSLISLANTYHDNDQPEPAVAIMKNWLDSAMRAKSTAQPKSLDSVGRFLCEAAAFEDAEKAFRKCMDLLKKQPDSWYAFAAKAGLGAALAGQEKYDQAEPLLTAGYQGMKTRLRTVSFQDRRSILFALRQLIKLNQATGNDEEVKRWQNELQKLQRRK